MNATERILYLNLECNPVCLEELYETINSHALHLMGMGQLMEYVLTKAEGVLSLDDQGHIMLIRDTLWRIGRELDDKVIPETIWTEIALQDGFDNALKRLQEGRDERIKRSAGKD